MQAGCLEVLLKEGGADANAPDASGVAPIFWLVGYRGGAERDKERELAAGGARVSAATMKRR